MVSPRATASESAWCGSPRLAFLEPSSGSITTSTGSAASNPKSTRPRSSLTAPNRAPAAWSFSSRRNTAASAAASISSVRSPPSPRVPVSRARCAVVGAAASTLRSSSVAARAAPSQSGASALTRRILRRCPRSRRARRSTLRSRTPAARTGKTHAPVERFAWLVEQGTPADAILAFTFSPAAADDLRERIEARVPARYEELSVTTFQAFCARLLREEALEAGIDPFAAPVTPSDRLALLLERIDELPLASHDLRGNPSSLLGTIVERIDRLKDELVTAGDYAAWASKLPEETGAERARAEREREFAAIYAAHDRMLAAAGTLDFGDLVLHAFDLLRSKPHVRARLAARFQHVLVDDF